jgi:hypothetical protein
MNQNQNGKGDTYRPKTVSEKKWAENWNLIFKKKVKNSGTSRRNTRKNNHGI